MELIAHDDITVTSATQSETDMAARHEAASKLASEEPAEKTPAAGDKPTAESKVTAPAKKDGDVKGDEKAVESEADSDKPDAQLSEAARTLRRSRLDVRKQQFQRDIDTLRGTKGTLEREVSDLERRRESLRTTPPPAGEKKADATTPAAGTAPEFKFQTWDQYQEEHPEGTYEQFIDARTDARYEFNERQRADRVRREETARTVDQLRTAFKTAEDELKAATPDYDDALNAVPLTDVQLQSPQFRDLKSLVAQAGKVGPRIMYHLAKNPEDLSALLGAHSRADLVQEFGAVKRDVLRAASATSSAAPAAGAPAGEKKEPAPAAKVEEPSKPVTSAPAPVSPVGGGATHGRSLARIAEDTDDADEYIEKSGHGHLLKRAR